MNSFKNIEEIFEAYNKLRVLVIGDVMIDSYISGVIERMSPEAPVPVVLIKGKEDRLGGAANVALNIKAMGATPMLCSMIGDDKHGELFLGLMENQNLSKEGILSSKHKITTVKTRVMATNHQLLRIDEEDIQSLNNHERSRLIERIKHLIDEKIDVIIFEDYDKGTIDKTLIAEVVAIAVAKNIPVAVDPKNKNFNDYIGVTLFKPNLKELKEGLQTEINKTNVESLRLAGAILHDEREINMVMITLSEEGVFMSNGQLQEIFPAHIRNIVDVSGAGDTVISVAALSLALGLNARQIGILSNLSGGLVCEQAGVVPIDKKQLLEEAKQMSLFD
jgi:rfaE bifunctional protein kinase chain/domain